MNSLPSLKELEFAVDDVIKIPHSCGILSLAEALSLCELGFYESNNRGGQKINALSGTCVSYSSELKKRLEERKIEIKKVHSKYRGLHTLLKTNTSDRGEVLVDPTLGQFVYHPRVFIGSEEELKNIFLDPLREFLCGTRIWAVDHEITSRQEWFDLLYTIGEVRA